MGLYDCISHTSFCQRSFRPSPLQLFLPMHFDRDTSIFGTAFQIEHGKKRIPPPYTSTLPPSSSLIIFVILDIPRSTTVIRPSSSSHWIHSTARKRNSPYPTTNYTTKTTGVQIFSSSSCKQSREREMGVESYLSHYTFIPCFVVKKKTFRFWGDIQQQACLLYNQSFFCIYKLSSSPLFTFLEEDGMNARCISTRDRLWLWLAWHRRIFFLAYLTYVWAWVRFWA